ncbi:DGQHR domain [Klebsiella pneumoniae]|nr:DGQHR domain [Klebsiella pneumoniae]
MHLARTVTGLAGTVDFEHNVVPAKSSRLISFKALNDATKKMLNLRANSIPSTQQRDMAEKLWTAWAQAMRWNDIAQDDIAAEYRQEALGLHGIMINAEHLKASRTFWPVRKTETTVFIIGSRLYLSAGKGSVLIRRLAPLKLTGGRLKQRLKRCKS